MKALSLWQPWASAIAGGIKTIETRSWSTSYRGPLAIHAAKRITSDERELHFEAVKAGHAEARVGPFDRGVVLAVATLLDVQPTWKISPGLSELERFYGNYSPGRYAWILTDVMALPEPIVYRGAQGLFEVELTDPRPQPTQRKT